MPRVLQHPPRVPHPRVPRRTRGLQDVPGQGRAEKSLKWAPNFSSVFLGSQDLEAKIRPNQCIYSFPCTQCGCTYNYQSLCHEISLLQLLKNIKTFDFSENWLSNSINPNLAPTVWLQGK